MEYKLVRSKRKSIAIEIDRAFNRRITIRCQKTRWGSCSSKGNLNGIFDDMVCDARTFDEVLPDFIDFVGDSILVGHNIHAFDMKSRYECLRKELGIE